MQATLVGAVTPALTVMQTQHLHLSPCQEPEIQHIHQGDSRSDEMEGTSRTMDSRGYTSFNNRDTFQLQIFVQIHRIIPF